VLCSTEDLASCTPASVGESGEWAVIVSSAEDNRESYCKALSGKTLFSALYGTYTVTLNELKNVLKASGQAGQTKQEDGFKEVRSRKTHYTGEAACTPEKAALPTSTVTVATKNFFAPSGQPTLKMMPLSESKSTKAEATGKSGRPPPIILMSAANLIHLQKQLKGVAKQSFKFRNTKNGTRVITKDMVDYQAVKQFFETKSLSYYTFCPKVEKPIKAVICDLPINTSAEDIASGMVDLYSDVISVRHMSTTS
jgi:hypothetical protein